MSSLALISLPSLILSAVLPLRRPDAPGGGARRPTQGPDRQAAGRLQGTPREAEVHQAEGK